MNLKTHTTKAHKLFTILTVCFLLLISFSSPVGTSGNISVTKNASAEKKKNSHAVIDVRYSTTKTDVFPSWKNGIIEAELYEKRAPITTANFIKLAESGFYDDLLFHRVIDDFVIQGGDPNTRERETGTPVDWWDDGNGGSNEEIPLESHPDLTHIDGALGMARELGEPDSASSQFYICDGPQHDLDDTEENNKNRTVGDRGYAVFGYTVKGMDVVRDIATVLTTTSEGTETPDPLPDLYAHLHDHPVHDVVIREITIIHYEAEDDVKYEIFDLLLYGFTAILVVGIIWLPLRHNKQFSNFISSVKTKFGGSNKRLVHKSYEDNFDR